MARGPKPKPPTLPAPEPKGFTPDEPAGLSPNGRAEWRRLVPLLADLAPLVQLDEDSLRQYCEAVALWKRVVRELNEPGVPLVITTHNGLSQANPLIKISKSYETTMMKLSERFGLDPASRRKLELAARQVEIDPLLEAMASFGRSPVPFEDD